MTGRLVKLAGYVVLALSALFLGQRFYSNFDSLTAIDPGWQFYAALGIACLGYGILQLFLVAGLSVILKGLGAAEPYFTKVLIFHGRTNIAKYLPGNVFHFAGRQLMAKSFGWSQATAGLASLGETALVMLGAGLAILIYASMTDITAVTKLWAHVNAQALLFAVALGIAGLWFICTQITRFPWLAGYASSRNIQNFSRSLRPLLAITFYVFFFLIGGMIFWSLLAALSESWQWKYIATAGLAYSASWLVGNISPGASAGIGVREAILVFMLGSTVGDAQALIVAGGMRIVTTFGDLFLFMLALLLRRPASDEGPEEGNPTPL